MTISDIIASAELYQVCINVICVGTNKTVSKYKFSVKNTFANSIKDSSKEK